jgi:hypothetical protein
VTETDIATTVHTRADLVAAGPGADALIRRGRRSGRLATYAPGVYLRGEPDLTAWVAAAKEHVGRDLVVTGWAGCALLGIPGADPQPRLPVLVGPTNRKVSTPFLRVLPTIRRPRWKELVDGTRVASHERCVIDAARDLKDLAAVRHLVLSAVSDRSVPVSAVSLRAELRAGASRGRALVARALEDAERGAASAPEAEVCDLLLGLARSRRLPSFLLNPEVRLGGDLVGVPDGWFVDLGLAWEVDSQEHHGARPDLDRTMHKHERFAVLGVTVLHATPRSVRWRGADYGEVVVKAVRVRRTAPWQTPSGLRIVPRGPVLP